MTCISFYHDQKKKKKMFEDILVESSDRLRGTEEPEGHSVDLGARWRGGQWCKRAGPRGGR